jgi:hypothetical protein
MGVASAKCRVDGRSYAFGHRRLVFQDQKEINEIAHATVRRLSRTRIRGKLLSPVLLDRQGRHHDGRNVGET